MVRRKSGTGNERVLSSRVSGPCQDPNPNPWLPNTPPPSPPGSLPPVACYTHHFFVCLLVCFLLFSNQWQKNPLFNAKHPFSFRSKMPEKTGSALDPAGSTRRSLLFDRERSWPLSSLYLWICCSCCPRLWLRCWLSEAIRR